VSLLPQGTINSFVTIQDRGGPGACGRCRLFVGPIGHGVFTTLRYPANSRFPDDTDAFRFFDRHRKGKTNGVEADKPVYEGTTIANAFNYSIGWSGPTAGPGPITLGR
jgi:hypothetical protein